MKIISHLSLLLLLAGSITAHTANAQSWTTESLREIEELRLRQLQTVQLTSDIAAFSSDGCSGGQSRSWEFLAQVLPGFEDHFSDKPPWESCCVAHDRKYWRGIAVDGYGRRKIADQELRQCIVDLGAKITPQLSDRYSAPQEKVRHAFLLTADVMYQAVRIGGQPCSLLPWRWGYGWDNCAFTRIGDLSQYVSNLKYDEHITFFNTTAWLDREGGHWRVPIHAWIYEPEDSLLRIGAFAMLLESQYGLSVTVQNEANFRRRSNLLIADNERGKTLIIRFAGQDVTLPASAENGHVVSILKIPAEVVSAFAERDRLSYVALLQDGDKRRFEGQVKLVPEQGVSVISDIDDTIKLSHVTDHAKLLANTFFNDFQRIEGMSELFRRLADRGVSFHFVSSSPWQLYDPLRDFMQQENFPWASLNLKAVRFRDETLFNLFKKGTETKPGQIEPILQRYPQRRFILVGDSGEQDPEVYGDIARRYTTQIQHILIRNVGNAGAARFSKAFSKIDSSKWQVFDHPGQISVDDLLTTEQVIRRQ
ncbi:MAG: DUF2183 domain-containing protein [Gammaproteobacteria bacterium]|nr:DUF2183 domain-containing protein [Gammaproteobacteria bacterium]